MDIQLNGEPRQTEADITNEIDRYISWPGQALSYKLGEIAFVRLRAEVTNQRGELVAVSEYINMMRVAAKGADHADG